MDAPSNDHRLQDRRDRADLAAGRYDALFSRYIEVIQGTVRSVNLWNEADRQDAVQMACERLLREWQRGKQYRVPIRVVVVTVSRWVARGVRQKATVHGQSSAPASMLDRHAAPDPFVEFEIVDWMERLFDDLPPREREVMYLRYVDELPPGHVAEVLGIEPNAENQAHFRAVKALRLADAA
jgi:RNA polymerase sigma factor (sigma-70 family)